jgi:ABC-2 type transport system permease protein
LSPLGFAIAMLALGNVFSKTGWAPWFPWSIVPMLVGMVGSPAEALPGSSFVVLAVTFVAGLAATVAQFVYADNTQ